MELDRGNIQRTFSSARKGYDPAEVDRHLKAIADAVEALHAATPKAGVAGATGARVEAIVAAAEASAREIEERAEADVAAREAGVAARELELERQLIEVADRI